MQCPPDMNPPADVESDNPGTNEKSARAHISDYLKGTFTPTHKRTTRIKHPNIDGTSTRTYYNK